MAGIRVSIVMPVFQPLRLEKTLQALARQTAADRIEAVILAGKLDAVPDFAGLPGVFMAVEPPTIPNNRNRGVQAAKSEWICMLDADCLPDPRWLEAMLDAIETQPAQAYAGAVNLPPNSGYWSQCDHLAGFPLQAVGLIQPGDLPYAASLNFCVQRAVFDLLGGFDPTLLSSEDRDFCERMRMAGFHIKAVPDAHMIHDHNRDSYRAAAEHLRAYGRWTLRFRLKQRANAPRAKRLYWRALSIPILGHLVAAAHSLLRFVRRLFFQRAYRPFLAYLPGIAVLEWMFFLGMIETSRAHDN